MSKPIVVQYGIYGKKNSSVVRTINEDALELTFRELLEELTEPSANEHNVKLSDLEKSIAGQVRNLMDSADRDHSTILDIYSFKSDSNEKTGPYDLNARVSDHIENLIEVGEQELEGQIIPFKRINLLLKKDYMGGLSKYKSD